MRLIVTQSFLSYSRGDEITDPDTIEKILASEFAGHVVAVGTDITEDTI